MAASIVSHTGRDSASMASFHQPKLLQKMGLVTPKMELPTPKYVVTYARFTNRSNLRRATCVVTPFFNARNGVGDPKNGVDYSILFRDP